MNVYVNQQYLRTVLYAVEMAVKGAPFNKAETVHALDQLRAQAQAEPDFEAMCPHQIRDYITSCGKLSPDAEFQVVSGYLGPFRTTVTIRTKLLDGKTLETTADDFSDALEEIARAIHAS